MRYLTLAIVSLGLAAPASAQYANEVARRQALEEYRMGVERMDAGAYEQAAAAFLRSIKHDKNLPIAYYALGQAYMARQRYDDAVVAFVHAIDSLSAANLYEQDRQPDVTQTNTSDTQREMRESRNRTSGDGGRDAGGTFRSGPVVSGADRIRNTARQDGRSFEAEICLALGSALFRSGKLPEAEGEWRRAVELRSDFGEVWNNLAALYAQTGFKKPAEESVEAAEKAGYKVAPELKKQISEMK